MHFGYLTLNVCWISAFGTVCQFIVEVVASDWGGSENNPAAAAAPLWKVNTDGSSSGCVAEVSDNCCEEWNNLVR